MYFRKLFFNRSVIARFSSTCGDKRPTIFSLCSGAGKSGVAVFRISGPSSVNMLKSMTECEGKTFTTKHMLLKKIYHPSSKEQIDKGLVLWFPGPNSLTGEDVCELHVHGGPAIIKQIYNALSSFPNSRQALPGEFIKRSFENGKVDLTQVEGLGDLLNAENEMQRRQALKMLEGDSKHVLTKWSDKILKGMAHIEAFIDFGEEENMGDKIFKDVKQNMSSLKAEVDKHLKEGGVYERIRDGLRVCIVGEPNVGKSSLLNSLCRRPVSIVTSHAGTTRDIIEVPMKVEGHQVILSDTAGLRQNVPDEVETIGIARAYNQSEKSDVLILVVDSTSSEVERLCKDTKLDDYSMKLFVMDQLNKLELFKERNSSTKRLLVVFNKVDIASEVVISAISKFQVNEEHKSIEVPLNLEEFFRNPETRDSTSSLFEELPAESSNKILNESLSLEFAWCATSCCIDNGLEGLGASLKHFVNDLFQSGNTGSHQPINARHQHHLEKVSVHLDEFHSILSEPPSKLEYDARLELSAECLRSALHQIGLITGRITTDQILSQIFKDFCIGK